MKKTTFILACFSMCVLLTSCSAKADSSSTNNTDISVTDTSVTDTVITEAEIVTLPVEEKQVVNKTPATYESFGSTKTEKDDFKNKIEAESDIPVISVTTSPDDKIVSLDNYVSCVVDVFNTDESMEINEASAGIRVRGNSSAYYGDVNEILSNSVPYRIKFDEKTNMLGLNDGNKFKSWVLLKSDWDLIRNDIALRFGRAIMGDTNYCSDAQLVHLYVNEEFKGIYLLCEQCQINKNRVNVTEVAEGYTGNDIGYYLELDNYFDRDEKNHWINMDYDGATVTDINGEERQFEEAGYSIKNDLYSQNQIDFIDKYMNNIFTILYQACEKDIYYTFDENYDLVVSDYTNAEDTIKAVIDVDSVRDMYILYEITHDYDCGEGSFFSCIDFSADSTCKKLKFTSPWDFNWAYNDSVSGYYAAAFNAMSFVNQYGDRSNPWFILFAKQEWFQNSVKAKWAELEKSLALENCIDEEKAYLETYKKDLSKTDEWATDSANTLFDWIEKRIYWLNAKWTNE